MIFHNNFPLFILTVLHNMYKDRHHTVFCPVICSFPSTFYLRTNDKIHQIMFPVHSYRWFHFIFSFVTKETPNQSGSSSWTEINLFTFLSSPNGNKEMPFILKSQKSLFPHQITKHNLHNYPCPILTPTCFFPSC